MAARARDAKRPRPAGRVGHGEKIDVKRTALSGGIGNEARQRTTDRVAPLGTEVDLEGLDHMETRIGLDREINFETPDLPGPDRARRRADENEENEEQDERFHDRESII